ncbi:MAG: bifunctional glutamate N-acetyltransferase/amino-acid acetyltransferase ArgJ [Dehalococcoidia bacterium]|nr:bifunctional glutamate N-acetyltransferase/amino-acid acetyltransferase ArgJ [Dehalococcoidia bacterium]
MAKIEVIEGGTVTTPSGFLAGAVVAGIKEGNTGKPDLAILYSEGACTAAALFTTNKVKAAPILVSQKHLAGKSIAAIVANSGCANACTMEQGLLDAEEMATLAAGGLGVRPEEVLVASTGVIGVPLPMGRIREGIERVKLERDGGHDFARAVMTTDTVAKERALSVSLRGGQCSIGGVVKGSGMIHPNMATLLCFLTTDATVEKDFLQKVLKSAVAGSFNMVTVDGDTSTNDSIFLLANGLCGLPDLRAGTEEGALFQEAVTSLCTYLARCVATDGEGATRLIEVTVEGAKSLADARRAARTIAGSFLVKAAVHGGDPNWGRIMAALGRSGVAMVESKVELAVGGVKLLERGRLVYHTLDSERVRQAFMEREVSILVRLNMGKGKATAWGCDLSEEYVTINSAYAT